MTGSFKPIESDGFKGVEFDPFKKENLTMADSILLSIKMQKRQVLLFQIGLVQNILLNLWGYGSKCKTLFLMLLNRVTLKLKVVEFDHFKKKNKI